MWWHLTALHRKSVRLMSEHSHHAAATRLLPKHPVCKVCNSPNSIPMKLSFFLLPAAAAAATLPPWARPLDQLHSCNLKRQPAEGCRRSKSWCAGVAYTHPAAVSCWHGGGQQQLQRVLEQAAW